MANKPLVPPFFFVTPAAKMCGDMSRNRDYGFTGWTATTNWPAYSLLDGGTEKKSSVFPSAIGVGQLLVSEAQPLERAAQAGVLGKADSAARQELPGFDPSNGFFYQLPELLPLFIANGGAQVLSFGWALADEDNECDLWFACDPWVANQLRIKG
jgi:hypothetical protein